MRRAKIVCTLGPATSTPGADPGARRRRHGRGAAQPEPRDLRRPREGLPPGPGGLRRDRARRRRLRRPPGPEDPARPVQGGLARASRPARRSRSPPATSTATTRSPRRRTRGCPATSGAGDQILIDDGKVRLRVTEVDGDDVHTTVVDRRPHQQQQGHQPARRAVSACRRCRRRTSRTCAGRCTSRVDFIALSFVRSAKDVEDVRQIMREEGVLLPVIAKIEKPQAIDNLDEIIKAFDGVHGRPRRPRRGVPARGRAVPAEARHREGPPQRQAGDRRDPDARVDDQQPRPHAGRGLRRRQRRARRRRRGDALRRDQRGGVPHRDRRARWPGSSRPPRTTSCTRWPPSTGSPAPAAA